MTSPTNEGKLPDRPRSSFDAGRLSRRYAFLRNIPAALFSKVIACTHGSLEERVAGLQQWRTAFQEGHVPSADGLLWPTQPHAQALLSDPILNEVAAYCRGNAEILESLLESVLDSVSAGDLSFHQAVESQLEELRRIEETRRRARAKILPPATAQDSPEEVEGEQTEDEATSDDFAKLREVAERHSAGAWADAAAGSIKGRWSRLLGMWREIADVFGELGLLTGLGRDLSLGVLKSRGWMEAKKLAELLRQLPQLKEIVRSLGRLQTVQEDDPSASEIIYKPVQRVREELRDVRTPHVPSEMRGIERSDAIARMLPSEAMLLQHPLLKLVWHARRAERSLLTYRVEGVMTELVEIEEPSQEGTPKPLTREKLERGPVIFCLDTSGSMQGAPETVAKALVLEAVRVAHAELRQCFLYAFSGPAQVVEHELSLEPEGIDKLLAFLAMSFGGGTDVAGPLNSAATRLGKEGWNRADIVLVSDGEFPVPTDAEQVLRNACKEKSARVHGVLIGAERSPAMERLCDPLHRFSDWDAMKLVR